MQCIVQTKRAMDAGYGLVSSASLRLPPIVMPLLGSWLLCEPGHHLAAWPHDWRAATTDGLGDGQKTGGRTDLTVPDELMPLDLQQLSLALQMEGPENSSTDRGEFRFQDTQTFPFKFQLQITIRTALEHDRYKF